MQEEIHALQQELSRLNVDIVAARHRLRVTLDAAGASCGWDWDIAENRLYADARFAEITNQDPVTLVDGAATTAFFSAIHPEDLTRIKLAVAGMLAGAEVFSKEYRLLRSDGGFRWVYANGRAVLADNDDPVRFTGMLIDITEQKKTQEQLRIAQTAGGIGTFEHISGYSTITVSDEFCRLFGLHPTRILPIQTLNALINPEDGPIIDVGAADAFQDKANFEFRITRANDGTERWLARRGEYVEDIEARGRRYLGVIYDVTDAKRTQQNLRIANDTLAARARESLQERDRIWQNSRDLLVIVGIDGIFRDVNPAWSDILGHDSHEVIGHKVIDFIWPEDRQDVRTVLRNAGQRQHAELEIRLSHKDGTARVISWMTSHEGDLVYAYGRDITLEKQQLEVLRETEAQLRQAQKMEAVGQLTGGIAHDFNNMLTGVIGSLSIIKRRISAGRLTELDKFIDAATSSAERATALTHRLLAFSRRQPLDRQAVDVTQLIASMEDLFRRTLGEQVELCTAINRGTWQPVTDANQLESAILNLVINARDAMPNGGKLTIETSNATFDDKGLTGREGLRPGQYVVVAVSDTGTGMSKDTIQKAFEPFFTTKPIGQGTGLGLSMIYGFAQQSGGHVRIYSELGRGTTIKLYLPGTDEKISVGAPPVSEKRPPRGAGETILVVEDDTSVRMLVVDVLTDLGYQVLQAIDSIGALSILEDRRRIDLLVSDVGLPGLNGRQLADIAIAARPDLKVLFVTGYAAMAASRAEFLAPGMQMMTKPFAIDELAQTVREILQQS